MAEAVALAVAAWIALGALAYVQAARAARGRPDITSFRAAQVVLLVLSVAPLELLSFWMFLTRQLLAGVCAFLTGIVGGTVALYVGNRMALWRHCESAAQRQAAAVRLFTPAATRWVTKSDRNVRLVVTASTLATIQAWGFYFLHPAFVGLTGLFAPVMAMPLAGAMAMSAVVSEGEQFRTDAAISGAAGLSCLLTGTFFVFRFPGLVILSGVTIVSALVSLAMVPVAAYLRKKRRLIVASRATAATSESQSSI